MVVCLVYAWFRVQGLGFGSVKVRGFRVERHGASESHI